MGYKHINDCWEAIREAKTIEEVENLFEEFPRWSGDWEVVVENDSYVVYNTYFDKHCDLFDTECETLDIEVENEDEDEDDEDDDRSELPWDYGKHFN